MTDSGIKPLERVKSGIKFEATTRAQLVASSRGTSIKTDGLSTVDDGKSAILRDRVAEQSCGFGAQAQGFDNDATICAIGLERGIPLITGDYALANAVAKLGGEARWFAPGA